MKKDGSGVNCRGRKAKKSNGFCVCEIFCVCFFLHYAVLIVGRFWLGGLMNDVLRWLMIDSGKCSRFIGF